MLSSAVGLDSRALPVLRFMLDKCNEGGLMCECTDVCCVVLKFVLYGRVAESLVRVSAGSIGVRRPLGRRDAMILERELVIGRCFGGKEQIWETK